MSERDTLRTALNIFTHQLTNLTFDGTDLDITFDEFIARFDSILNGISTVTHSKFSSSVKKTMLQAQLRGGTSNWVFVTKGVEFAELGYEAFKEELRKEYSS
jgi:hypothetical protein